LTPYHHAIGMPLYAGPTGADQDQVVAALVALAGPAVAA